MEQVETRTKPAERSENNVQNEVVNTNTAQKEVDLWLDYKHVSQSKRKKQEDFIETLVDAISDGLLTLNHDTFVFTQKLRFAGGGGLTELTYKPRIQQSEFDASVKGLKAGDGRGAINAYASVLTDKSSGTIAGLDNEDHSFVSSFALFFM